MDTALIIALTLFGEVRGEPLSSKMAVGSVIYNRAGGRSEQFAAVCKAKKQFSCWNKGTPRGPRKGNKKEQDAYADCLGIASAMLSGKFKPTTTALFYHDLTIDAPYWARGRKMVLAEARLRFYA